MQNTILMISESPVKVYAPCDHHIRNHLIDPNALFVIEKLQKAGYIAYLVGGSVRDLLMSKSPKDYDVSTSAKPEEIKKLFGRQCILVGRRFLLAHIRFGRQVIEVATFRSSGDLQGDQLITLDNIWGTAEEDVLRRDFTINGLFYDPKKHEIIDYVGGFPDLQKHLLRSIGIAEIRFRQDPVRMIRFQKFRARFGFQVEDEAVEALFNCRHEIIKSSPARVLEEIFRMLESGSAEPFFRLMTESELLKILFPELDSYFHKEIGELILAYLKAADSMNQKERDEPLDRCLLTACLIYPILDCEINRQYLERAQIPHIGEVMELSSKLIHTILFSAFSHFPRRIRQEVQTICQLQYRLTPLDSKKKVRTKVVRQRDFQDGLQFLKLRTLIDHKLFKTYTFWKKAYKDFLEEAECSQD